MDTVRGFLAKYDTNGSLVSFLAVGEDGNSTHVQALGSDSEDNVFVTGNFVGNITLGTFSLQAQPGYESVFIARFSDLDQDFVWANASSGNGSVVVYNLATNEDGYSCLIATFSGNVTLDDETEDDDSDQILVVVAQFDSNGTLLWFRAASTESALPYGIHIDSDRNCTAAGSFKEFFLLDPYSQVNVSDTGAFFVKFSSEGNTTVLKTTLGDEDDIFTGVTCSDETGDCWVSGFFTHNLTIDGVAYGASSSNASGNSSDIDTLLLDDDDDGVDEFDDEDNRRAIVLKFDSEGNVVDYLAASPGNHSSAATSVANVDEEIWVTGVFDESLSLGSFNLTSPARLTLFVFRANSTDTNLSSDASGGSDEIM